MGIDVQFVDEVIGGPRGKTRQVAVPFELIDASLSARAVIEQRVRSEWERAQASREPHFESRAALLDWLATSQTHFFRDVDTAVETAQRAVNSGTIIFFWNDQQITDLDAKLHAKSQNEALFLKMVPLIGG